jgi:hypothetical protein
MEYHSGSDPLLKMNNKDFWRRGQIYNNSRCFFKDVAMGHLTLISIN